MTCADVTNAMQIIPSVCTSQAKPFTIGYDNACSGQGGRRGHAEPGLHPGMERIVGFLPEGEEWRQQPGVANPLRGEMEAN
eukprot:scaffold210208_cov50-Prasinocladus_malaysianus.AAC.1